MSSGGVNIPHLEYKSLVPNKTKSLTNAIGTPREKKRASIVSKHMKYKSSKRKRKAKVNRDLSA